MRTAIKSQVFSIVSTLIFTQIWLSQGVNSDNSIQRHSINVSEPLKPSLSTVPLGKSHTIEVTTVPSAHVPLHQPKANIEHKPPVETNQNFHRQSPPKPANADVGAHIHYLNDPGFIHLPHSPRIASQASSLPSWVTQAPERTSPAVAQQISTIPSNAIHATVKPLPSVAPQASAVPSPAIRAHHIPLVVPLASVVPSSISHGTQRPSPPVASQTSAVPSPVTHPIPVTHPTVRPSPPVASQASSVPSPATHPTVRPSPPVASQASAVPSPVTHPIPVTHPTVRPSPPVTPQAPAVHHIAVRPSPPVTLQTSAVNNTVVRPSPPVAPQPSAVPHIVVKSSPPIAPQPSAVPHIVVKSSPPVAPQPSAIPPPVINIAVRPLPPVTLQTSAVNITVVRPTPPVAPQPSAVASPPVASQASPVPLPVPLTLLKFSRHEYNSSSPVAQQVSAVSSQGINATVKTNTSQNLWVPIVIRSSSPVAPQFSAVPSQKTNETVIPSPQVATQTIGIHSQTSNAIVNPLPNTSQNIWLPKIIQTVAHHNIRFPPPFVPPYVRQGYHPSWLQPYPRYIPIDRKLQNTNATASITVSAAVDTAVSATPAPTVSQCQQLASKIAQSNTGTPIQFVREPEPYHPAPTQRPLIQISSDAQLLSSNSYINISINKKPGHKYNENEPDVQLVIPNVLFADPSKSLNITVFSDDPNASIGAIGSQPKGLVVDSPQIYPGKYTQLLSLLGNYGERKININVVTNNTVPEVPKDNIKIVAPLPTTTTKPNITEEVKPIVHIPPIDRSKQLVKLLDKILFRPKTVDLTPALLRMQKFLNVSSTPKEEKPKPANLPEVHITIPKQNESRGVAPINISISNNPNEFKPKAGSMPNITINVPTKACRPNRTQTVNLTISSINSPDVKMTVPTNISINNNLGPKVIEIGIFPDFDNELIQAGLHPFNNSAVTGSVYPVFLPENLPEVHIVLPTNTSKGVAAPPINITIGPQNQTITRNSGQSSEIKINVPSKTCKKTKVVQTVNLTITTKESLKTDGSNRPPLPEVKVIVPSNPSNILNQTSTVKSEPIEIEVIPDFNQLLIQAGLSPGNETAVTGTVESIPEVHMYVPTHSNDSSGQTPVKILVGNNQTSDHDIRVSVPTNLPRRCKKSQKPITSAVNITITANNTDPTPAIKISVPQGQGVRKTCKKPIKLAIGVNQTSDQTPNVNIAVPTVNNTSLNISIGNNNTLDNGPKIKIAVPTNENKTTVNITISSQGPNTLPSGPVVRIAVPTSKSCRKKVTDLPINITIVANRTALNNAGSPQVLISVPTNNTHQKGIPSPSINITISPNRTHPGSALVPDIKISVPTNVSTDSSGKSPVIDIKIAQNNTNKGSENMPNIQITVPTNINQSRSSLSHTPSINITIGNNSRPHTPEVKISVPTTDNTTTPNNKTSINISVRDNALKQNVSLSIPTNTSTTKSGHEPVFNLTISNSNSQTDIAQNISFSIPTNIGGQQDGVFTATFINITLTAFVTGPDGKLVNQNITLRVPTNVTMLMGTFGPRLFSGAIFVDHTTVKPKT